MQTILQRVLCFSVLIFLASGAFAQTRVITPAAGNGTAGYSGDGGPATAARLNRPNDVTVDSAGDLYIADRNNNRVRKVDTGTGEIRTVAGNGTAGWFFSGGPAIHASLDHPSGVAADSEGNFYIADLLDNDISRIHVVSSGGIISTIQLPVVLKGAVAIALDSSGNLYIAEQAGHRIRKLVLASGSFTTIAGTGAPGFAGDGGSATAAALNAPVHLAIDSRGVVYFSDSLNNRIRKVENGIISTVAGTGAVNGPGGFSGDGGPATAAELNNPRGVAVDSAGNIFIADTLNKRIRRVNANTGNIATVISGQLTGAGCTDAASSMESPDSLSVNAAGNLLYIADDKGNRIWKLTLDPNNVPPRLTSIAPASGTVGRAVDVVLTGSAFLGGAGASGGAACLASTMTILVSGSGIDVSNVNVNSDSSVRATLTIAPNAELGARNVTVTTDSGTSGPVQFTVTAEPVPVPTLTSITPGSGLRGSSVTVTLTGTNFDARPGATSVAVNGAGISTGDVQVAGPSSLTVTFTIAGDTAIGSYNVNVATAGGSSNAVSFAVQPEGLAFTYGFPQTLNPTEQAPIQVGLATALPDPVTAKLTLTFSPNATNGKDDPNVMFVNNQASTRTVDVTFPPNTSTAELSLPSGVLQAGTVAGTIELAILEAQVGGVATTPSSGDFDVQVPRLAPVITSVRILNRSSAGFDVEVTGYSTSREISAATFNFGAASGALLLTVQLQPDVTTAFGDYYLSETSTPVGGAFVYLQPFIVEQGDVNAVASVTVTLTNSVGTSEPRRAQ